jgi:hypothetical protein
MSLRGQNNGGYICPLPAGFDDTLDLTLLLRVRRNGAQGNTDTIFRLLNADRTRGISLITGGGTGTGGTPDDLFAVCGAGSTTGWGSSASHNGRGMGAAGAISATAFDTVVVVVRGPAAADNTGTSGAQQIHEVWRNGSFGSVVAAASAQAVSATGARMNFLYRDGSTSVWFDGWIADLCVWQGWRPDAAAYARIASNDDPRTLGPAPLVFRSLRSALAAEIGDTPMTAAGTAPTIDAGVNPPPWHVALAPTGARQAQTAAPTTLAALAAVDPAATLHAQRTGTPLLTASTVLAPARAAHGHSSSALLSVSGSLHPAAGRHALRSGSAALSLAGLVAPGARRLPVAGERRVHGATIEPRTLRVALG